MSAYIVVVHNDPTFLHPLAATFRDTGHQVDAYDSSIQAWDALAEGRDVEVLITRVRFPLGEPHGVALAHHARAHHPHVLILFTAAATDRRQAREIWRISAGDVPDRSGSVPLCVPEGQLVRSYGGSRERRASS